MEYSDVAVVRIGKFNGECDIFFEDTEGRFRIVRKPSSSGAGVAVRMMFGMIGEAVMNNVGNGEELASFTAKDILDVTAEEKKRKSILTVYPAVGEGPYVITIGNKKPLCAFLHRELMEKRFSAPAPVAPPMDLPAAPPEEPRTRLPEMTIPEDLPAPTQPAVQPPAPEPIQPSFVPPPVVPAAPVQPSHLPKAVPPAATPPHGYGAAPAQHPNYTPYPPAQQPHYNAYVGPQGFQPPHPPQQPVTPQSQQQPQQPAVAYCAHYPNYVPYNPPQPPVQPVQPPVQPAQAGSIRFHVSSLNTDVNITLPSFTVGRDSTSDLSLARLPNAKYIARRQATVFRSGGKWYIRDENSTNGTFVNNRQVPGGQPQMLNQGDFVSFAGKETLIVLELK